MFEHTSCPVCNGESFKKIGQTATVINSPPQSLPQAGGNVILRYVLGLDTIHVHTLRCRRCDHLFLSPSFEDDELDRYYSQECGRLTKDEYRLWERVTGDSWAAVHNVRPETRGGLVDLTEEVMRLRSAKLASFVIDSAQQATLDVDTILDIGGNSGQLTSSFASARRYVFDKYPAEITAQVTPLHNMDEVEKSSPFDLFVLSHVLEHVPRPTDFLKTFSKFSTQMSLVYVEVPLEYCGAVLKRRGVPLSGHVNYFTPKSVRALLLHAGFGQILKVSRCAAWYGAQRMVVIKALARRSTGDITKDPRSWFLATLLWDSLITWRTRRRHAADLAEVLAGGPSPIPNSRRPWRIRLSPGV